MVLQLNWVRVDTPRARWRNSVPPFFPRYSPWPQIETLAIHVRVYWKARNFNFDESVLGGVLRSPQGHPRMISFSA